MAFPCKERGPLPQQDGPVCIKIECHPRGGWPAALSKPAMPSSTFLWVGGLGGQRAVAGQPLCQIVAQRAKLGDTGVDIGQFLL